MATTVGGLQHVFASSPFLIGDWTVHPDRRLIARRGEVQLLEPRHMDVLCALASRRGQVVSVEELLDACWNGGFFGDNPVHKAIAIVRRALADDAKAPRYIATVRKRGYLLFARVRLTRPIEDRLEAAIRRWGALPAFQRRIRALGPDDAEGWQILTATLLRVASSLVTDGALPHALGAVDEARGWLAGQVVPSGDALLRQSTKNAASSAST
ncbi:winged helix-turn-helix domain-containing protein [Luteibacter sp.]|uniref:winged helix-turn-helix domain-containing protein n=1 Tax=Luteibacter sp. TaxID=1886636 RepID=UPI0039C9CAAB